MENQDLIVNRVAASALVSFDLEQYRVAGDRATVDIKDQLYEGLILKEKDFRNFIQHHNWSSYKDKLVAVHCSSDAIVPTWAFMLVAIALQPYAKRVVFGTLDDLEVSLYKSALDAIDWNQFANAKVVVKGCSDESVPLAAYVEVSSRLRGVAASIMFGEPCSTVPLYKRLK
jgi:hypothetical protein